MEEELKYLRDKFLKHYQTKKCAQIYEPILEEENPQPSFEKPQRIEERNPSENHSWFQIDYCDMFKWSKNVWISAYFSAHIPFFDWLASVNTDLREISIPLSPCMVTTPCLSCTWSENPQTFLLVLRIVALKSIAIWIGVSAVSIFLVVFEATLVSIPIRILKDSLAIKFIFFEFSFIEIPIGEFEFSSAVFLIEIKIASVPIVVRIG